MKKATVTHDEITKASIDFLIKVYRCSVVISELRNVIAEVPDVFGFDWRYSVVLESKVSVADFKKDVKKEFRKKPELGIGMFRYYVVPDELITEKDLFDKKWGIIYVSKSGKNYRFKTIKKADRYDEYNYHDERKLIVSCMKRLAGHKLVKGININAYKYSGTSKAELHIIHDSYDIVPFVNKKPTKDEVCSNVENKKVKNKSLNEIMKQMGI